MSQLPFEQLKAYENRWVALLEPDQKIVGSGNDAEAAIQDAQRRGYTEVTLFLVPRLDAYFIGNTYGV